MQGKTLTQDQIEAIIRLFPDHTKKEIAQAIGISLSSVDRVQMRYHLRKSLSHLHKMGQRAGKASSIARGGQFIGNHTPEAKAKRVETYRETYRREDMRVRWGLEQKTKIRLKHGCKRYRDQVCYLRHLGYIVDEARKEAYYTSSTHRATRLERLGRGVEKGPMRSFFNFKEYDGRLD